MKIIPPASQKALVKILFADKIAFAVFGTCVLVAVDWFLFSN